LFPTNTPQNYKVYCTLNNIPIDDSLADTLPDDTMDVDDDADQNNDDDEDDEDMPEFFKDVVDPSGGHDTKTPSRNPKSKVALVVRAKITKVLAETELADKRSRQCDQNDFLRLLLGRLRPCHLRGEGANGLQSSTRRGFTSHEWVGVWLVGRRAFRCWVLGADITVPSRIMCLAGIELGKRKIYQRFLHHCAHMMLMGLLHHGVVPHAPLRPASTPAHPRGTYALCEMNCCLRDGHWEEPGSNHAHGLAAA
jgi:hypothetical protein